MKKKILVCAFTFVCICFLGITSANAISREEAVNWAKTQANNGTKYDVDNLYGYQCSDFASAYINYIIYGDPYYWLNNNHAGFNTYNGCNYFYQTYPSGWQKIENTPDFVPEPGDILCFAAGVNNDAGHVAIAIEGCTVSYMKAIDQDGYRQTAPQYSTLNYFTNYYNFQGVIRPKWDGSVDLGTDFYAYIINSPAWKMVVRSNNGNNVELQSENGKANQLWKFERRSDGAYYIRNLEDGAYLDVDMEGSTEGTNVKVCGFSGSSAQEWTIYGSPNDYRLTAGCTDCVMDLQNGATDDGTNVQMWTSNDSNAQKFQIYKIELRNPTLNVSSSNSYEDTVFSWNTVYGETTYDVNIYREDGTLYKTITNIDGKSTTIKLPAGNYKASVKTSNYYYSVTSNEVSFSVKNPSISATVNSDENIHTVTAKIENLNRSCKMIVSGYKNGELVLVKTKSYADSGEVFVMTGDIDTIKVMAWDSMQSIKPVCNAKIIKNEDWITE